jgi:hypothetical protein
MELKQSPDAYPLRVQAVLRREDGDRLARAFHGGDHLPRVIRIPAGRSNGALPRGLGMGGGYPLPLACHAERAASTLRCFNGLRMCGVRRNAR